MSPKYRLYPPGSRKNNKSWIARGVLNGRRYEVLTGAADEPAAHQQMQRFLVMLRDDMEREAHLRPEPMPLGRFEDFLKATFYLDERGLLRRRSDGRLAPVERMKGGYLQVRILFEGRMRYVMEHRVVFLLHHGWLPRSVDHKNRVRSDNHPDNLTASTPYLQQRNVHRGGSDNQQADPQ